MDGAIFDVLWLLYVVRVLIVFECHTYYVQLKAPNKFVHLHPLYTFMLSNWQLNWQWIGSIGYTCCWNGWEKFCWNAIPLVDLYKKKRKKTLLGLLLHSRRTLNIVFWSVLFLNYPIFWRYVPSSILFLFTFYCFLRKVTNNKKTLWPENLEKLRSQISKISGNVLTSQESKHTPSLEEKSQDSEFRCKQLLEISQQWALNANKKGPSIQQEKKFRAYNSEYVMKVP